MTDGDWHAGEPAWSPDGGEARVRRGHRGRRGPAPPRAGLTVDASSPTAEPQLAGLPEGSAAPSSWTPDGSALLVVGFAGVPVGHARLLRVPLDGGDPSTSRRRSTAT